MLNGLDPIIIFQFKKLNPFLAPTLAKIPLVSEVKELIELPPIPIYFSLRAQSAIGLYIDSESKNVDIQTITDTMTDGSSPAVDQKAIANTVTINLFGKKGSVQLALITAMIDQVFDRLTSKEYAISYLNGAITIFGGLLHSYSVDQNPTNDLVLIKLELTKGEKQPTKGPEVPGVTPIRGAVPLQAGA